MTTSPHGTDILSFGAPISAWTTPKKYIHVLHYVYFLLVLYALVGAVKESIPTRCGEVVVQRSQLPYPATPISVVVASYFKCPDFPFTCAWRKHVREILSSTYMASQSVFDKRVDIVTIDGYHELHMFTCTCLCTSVSE